MVVWTGKGTCNGTHGRLYAVLRVVRLEMPQNGLEYTNRLGPTPLPQGQDFKSNHTIHCGRTRTESDIVPSRIDASTSVDSNPMSYNVQRPHYNSQMSCKSRLHRVPRRTFLKNIETL